MTQYNNLNVKLSNLKLNKLKSWIKDWRLKTKAALNLSSNVVGNCNDETDFSHKLPLTNTQVSRFCKAFMRNKSANIKLSKTQLHKAGLSGRFPGRVLRPLPKSLFIFKEKMDNIMNIITLLQNLVY